MDVLISKKIDNDYAGEPSRPMRIFPELQAPVAALLNTRNAHADGFAVRTRNIFGQPGSKGTRYYHFTFSTPGDVKAPLGWYLSHAAQKELKRQLHGDSVGLDIANVNMKNMTDISLILAPFNREKKRSADK